MQQIQFFPIIFYYFQPESTIQAQLQMKTCKAMNKQQIKHQMDESIAEKQKLRWKFYLEIFERELIKNKEKYEKKGWEPEQDHLLVQLREKLLSWVQISKLISKTNPQICKRRYTRLTQNEKKWPKSLDQLIKDLYQNKCKKWSQIYNIISNNSQEEFAKYSIKKIKQRYFLHLKAGIQQREWQIAQDLKLLTLVKENGKKWKHLTANFLGRTELQLKNRYNGTLKLIQKRVLRKLNFLMKSKATKKNYQISQE